MPDRKRYLTLISKLLSIVLILAFGFFGAFSTSAATPRVLSFQGRLSNSSGDLLGSSGTNYYFKFSIYNGSTGGTQLWTSSASGIPIKVTQGVFNTLLGDTTAGFNSLDLDFDSTTNYYLEVQVSSDNSSFETLAPRQRIVSSGFAINADSVHGGRFINATGVGQFGSLATVSYSRFGTAVTSHGLTAPSDLLTSGILESFGQAFFDSNASVAGNFELTGAGSKLGINAGGTIDTTLEVGGAASISGGLSLGGNAALTGLLISGGTGSNSFAGSLSISKGVTANSYQGGGLTNCSSGGKLLYANGQFSCGTDLVGSSGALIGVSENGGSFFNKSSISFEPNGFNVAYPTGTQALVSIDYANGPASRSIAQNITGLWTFVNGASVSGGLEIGRNASVGGNITAKGTLGGSNFSGSSSGTNSGDVSLSGLNYLSLAGQTITAGKINLATHTIGTLNIASTSFGVSATGLQYSGGTLSLASGFNIPLTASTSNWNSFFQTPSSRIAAGSHLTWAGNTLNVNNDFLSLVGGSLSGGLIGTTASLSSNLEVGGIASVGGNVTAKGTLSASNFSGSSAGTNTGDVSLGGLNYLSLAGQALTANAVSLTNQVKGSLNIASTSLAVTATGLQYSGGTISNAAGFSIPLTASISNYDSFYHTPSTRITNGAHLSWSGNTLNVNNDFVALTGGTLSGNLIGTNASLSGTFEIGSYASIGGNITTKGTLSAVGITNTGNLTNSGTGSSSFAGSLDITKGLRAAAITGTGTLGITGTSNLNGATNITGALTILGGSNGLSFTGGGTNTISSTGTLQINSFQLGGPLNANSNNITSVALFGATNASVSNNLEITNTASIGGNATIKGNTTFTGTLVGNSTASNSFSGSLNISKSLTAAGLTISGLTNSGNQINSGTGSSSFAGSLNISKSLTVTNGISAGSFSTAGQFFSSGTGSNSFAGSLNLTKGLHATGNVSTAGLLSASNFSGSSSGTNTGDVSIGGLNYLSLAGQTITANLVSLTNQVKGTLSIASTSLAVTATGLTYSGGTISNTAGFSIPLTASTSDWNTVKHNYFPSSGGTLTGSLFGTTASFSNVEFTGYASIGGNATIKGNTTLTGTLIGNSTGSNSFGGSLNTSLGVHAGGNLTSAGLIIGSNTGSNSFAGSLDITKGLRAAAITGSGTLSIAGTSNLSATNISGLLSVTNTGSASFAGSIDAAKGVRTTQLTSSQSVNTALLQAINAGSLTINAFTLGGAITGNNQNITGIAQLSSTNASASNNLEIANTASIGGNITIKGNQTLTGTLTGNSTGSNSFAGSLNTSLGVHSGGNLTTLAQLFSSGTGSNSFAGSLNISKSLTATNTVTAGGFTSTGTSNLAALNLSGGLALGNNNVSGINALTATTINGFSLGGAIAGAGNNITGVGLFTATNASVSNNFELTNNASIGGNIVLKGNLVGSNTGSNSFSGSLNISKSLSAAGLTISGLTNSGNQINSGTGSSSFAGSLSLSKGLTANSYQGGGLSGVCSGSQFIQYSNGQFSCGTPTGSGNVSAQSGVAAGQITFWQTGTTASGSAKLTWDSTNKRFGINAGGTTDTALEVGGTASVSGSLTLGGTITSTNTGSNSFSGSINTSLGVHAAGNLTSAALFIGSGTGSNSFSGSLNIAKSFTATNTVTAGGFNTSGTSNLGITNLSGALSLGNNNITNVNTLTATTINGFSLGGAIAGAGNNITGIGLLTSGNASVSNNFELTNTASVGGNIIAKGSLSAVGITNTGNLTNSGTGSSSFAGSIDITKGLRAAAITGAGTLSITGTSNLNGAANITGALTVLGGSNGLSFTGGGTNTISSTGTLQINSFQLGGPLNANSNNITSIALFGATNASVSNNLEITNTASIGGNATIKGNQTLTGTFVGSSTASNTFAGSLNISKSLTAAGLTISNLTNSGNQINSGTGSSSFAGSLNISKSLTATANITAANFNTAGQFFSSGTGSNSFSGSLDLSKGLRTTNITGASLTIGAHTLTGSITGNNFNITGLTQLTSTIASHSGAIEIGSYASIGGNVTIKGNTTLTGTLIGNSTGSNSFGGSLTSSKGVHATNSIDTAGVFNSTFSTGSNSFSGSLNLGLGLHATGNLTTAGLVFQTTNTGSNSFSASLTTTKGIHATNSIDTSGVFNSTLSTGSSSFAGSLNTGLGVHSAGNVTTAGLIFQTTNTGSNSFSGSLTTTKGVHATNSIDTAGVFTSTSVTGSNSFAGSLTLSKGLTANSYHGAGLTDCNVVTQKLVYQAGQFSCQTDQTSGGGGIAFQTGMVAGQLAFYKDSATASGSAQLTWDVTKKRFGLGTSTPSGLFTMVDTSLIGSTATASFSIRANGLTVGSVASISATALTTGNVFSITVPNSGFSGNIFSAKNATGTNLFNINAVGGASFSSNFEIGGTASIADVIAKGPIVDVRAFGAKGDGKLITDASASAGINRFGSGQAVFTAADVGKNMTINGAGVAGAQLSTTIVSVISPTVVSLGVTPSTTISGQVATYGHDDAPAIQAAIDSLTSPTQGRGGGTILFPKGDFLIRSTITMQGSSITLKGVGSYADFDIGSTASISGTYLTWDGAAGGTMMNITAIAGATRQAVNRAGIQDMSFIGNGMQNAGVGLSINSVHQSNFSRLYFQDFTNVAITMNVVAITGEPRDNTKNEFDSISIRQIDTAKGVGMILDGDTIGNTSNNDFRDISVNMLNGAGVKFLNADNNRFWSLNVFRAAGGTANGVEFHGSNVNIALAARGNEIYYLSAGAGGTVAYASGSFPSIQNWIQYYSTQNGEPRPRVDSAASLFYNTDNAFNGMQISNSGLTTIQNARKLPFYLNDAFSGSTATSSFAINSLNTVANVASISALALTTGNGLFMAVPAIATTPGFTGNILDVKDAAGVDLFTLTGKGRLGLGNTPAPKGLLFLNDTLPGSATSGSFGIRSSNTIGSVASISATALTTGNIFNVRVASTSVTTGNIFRAMNTNLNANTSTLFVMTGKGRFGIGVAAPTGAFYLNDTLPGSVTSASFAIRSGTTIGSVASISATSLTTGNGLFIQVPVRSTTPTFTGNIIDAKDVAGTDLFTLTGKGRFGLGGASAPSGMFYIKDTNLGSASSGSFSILSSNTIGTVASISANSVTSGVGMSLSLNALSTGTGFKITTTNAVTTPGSLFAIRANSLSTGALASMSATGLGVGGSILNFTVRASTAGQFGNILLVKDTAGTTIASWSYYGRLATRGAIKSRGINSTCSGVNTGGSGCLDYAETYPTTDLTVEAGDLVGIDPVHPGNIQKALAGTGVVGVVSTNPGAVINGSSFMGGAEALSEIPAGQVPVALAGRVPLKVSTENGDIAIGDWLTISSTPGVAMKATKAGEVVGRALENYSGISAGQVITFMEPGYYNGEQLDIAANNSLSVVSDVGLANALLEQFSHQTTPVAVEMSDILADRVAASVEIVSPKVFADSLQINKIGTGNGAISILSDAIFFGRPYFNNDTAGFAMIMAGARSVDVTFTQDYLDQPVVNANISVEASDSISEDEIFDANIQYLVVKKTTHGFTIKLNKDAPGDIRFSWIALAVKSAKLFNSIEAATPTPAPDATITPTPSDTPNDESSNTPSPTPTITPTPSDTPSDTPIPTDTPPDPSPTP